jgi:type I restriction enzyme S subunit
MKWSQISLGEILHVKHGWAFKSESFSDTGEHIVLTPGNFYEEGGFKSRGDKDRFYSGDYPSEYLLSKGNVIVAMTEQGEGLLGSTALIPEDNRYLHNQRLGLVTIKDNVDADLFFVYKLFNTQMVRQQISGSASGAKVKHTAPERIYKCKVHLPPIQIQQKIAVILSAYDNLIENNLKRIKLLEEMAQITYEEWFVRLKFPGYETASIDSETALPTGWARKQIRSIGKVITGKTPSTENENNFGSDIPFIKTPDMAGVPYVSRTEQYLSKAGADSQKGKYLPKNSLIISCIGSAGIYALTAIASQTNQQINAIVFNNEKYTFYMYAHAKYLKPLLEALGSNGATMTNVNKSKFEQITVVMPTDELLIKFHERFKKNFESILLLLKQNQLLKEARDILLPRLMTGMIDVEQLVLPEPSSNTPSSSEQGQQAA